MSIFSTDDNGELIRDRTGFVRVSGIEEIRQGCTTKIRTHQGEIPTRTDLGINWSGLLSVASTDSVIANAVISRAVMRQPGIVSVDEVGVVSDRETRASTITYTATPSADLLRAQVISGSVVV